jgi:hypothetical protein
VVLWQLVEGDLEPAHPIAVTFPASSEAIDALLGTKLGSPRVVPDETKLALTNCAPRGSARSKTFGAVWHCSLLVVLESLLVEHPFSPSHFISLYAFSNACSIRPSRSAAQLHVGIVRHLKASPKRYKGLWRSPLKPTTSADRSTVASDRANIVRLFSSSSRKRIARRRSGKSTDSEVTAH